jgi:adenine-specific DNA-methyltransferase
MATLDWIGKKAVLNHHREVPYHLLKANDGSSFGVQDAGNLLVEGDNLLALKALLPYYAGQVKCIYIDPPYNTGNESWVYNDAVNSPQMKKWLGRVVGGDAEDLSRHDKWLCMMYPRLTLLRKFLREDGAIFISIDDNEIANLRCLTDEVFGPRNLAGTLTWYKRVSPANDAKLFSSDHEYIVVYAKNLTKWRPKRLPRTEKQLKNYSNPDNDPRGDWNSATYTCNKSVEERPNLYHGVTNPNTGEVIWPKRTAVWKYDPNTYQEHVRHDLIWWGKAGKAKMPRLKVFLSTVGDVVPRSILSYTDCGSTQEARTELLRIIPEVPFTTPKPLRLMQRILQLGAEKDSLIMDSFAGSDTLGHAVLQANKADGGSRRFITVEMIPEICRNVAAVRLKRAISGYSYQQGENMVEVEGLGSGFTYCELAEPLFDQNGDICREVGFSDLAAHIFFTEAGQPMAEEAKKTKSALLGIYNGIAIYLLFNGVLGDKTINGGNILTGPVLSELPPFDGPKVIYGEGSRLGQDKLRREGIVFKQIPYEIRVS